MRKFSNLGITPQDLLLLAALAAAFGASVAPLLGLKAPRPAALLQPESTTPAMTFNTTALLVPAASFRETSDRASSLPSRSPLIPPAWKPVETRGALPEACTAGFQGISPFAARRSSASASDATAMALVLAMVCKGKDPGQGAQAPR